MQLAKIRRISRKKKDALIEACKTLLAWYKGELKRLENCPLCVLKENWHVNCSNICPWYLIEGEYCEDKAFFMGYKYFVIDVRKRRYSRWVILRLKQLPQWIKILREN